MAITGGVWREPGRDRTFNLNFSPRIRGFIAMRKAPMFQSGHRQVFFVEETAEAM